MAIGDDHLERAVASRDPRFDGWVYLAVTSTGIYCRPSCSAMTPRREHMRFYRSAAAAQRNGFRACKRCRPDAAPGSPEWNLRSDAVGRAMRLIGDGVVDREGVAGLARRIGYSERQLNRLVTVELGAGPIAIARSRRAQSARTLIETTALPFTEIAFAAGFSSVRQFNDTVREVYASSPTALRAKAQRGSASAPGTISLRLAYRKPFAWSELLGFLAARAVTGVEEVVAGRYRRVLRLPGGVGVADLADTGGAIALILALESVADLAVAVERCRRLLDLDADPVAVDDLLGGDPDLAPLVAVRPGLRVPGAVAGDEIAVRAVLGQQISVAAARTIAGRLTRSYGEPLRVPDGGLTHAFPTAAALAAADELPMPATRARTLRAICAALASGTVDLGPGGDRDGTRRALLGLPGIGPWTASYIAMRALRDPDVFLDSDLGVRHALDRLGLAYTADRWRPWRSYATMHLWASL